MKLIDCDKPETMLAVAPGVEAGVPIDAINAACARADAVLQLLQSHFDGSEVRCSDSVIIGALCDVQGTLGLIKTLAQHGHQTACPKAPRAKPAPHWPGEGLAATARAGQ